MATTEEILSGKNLTGLIQNTVSGVPNRLPPAFLTPNRTIKGHTGTYRRVDGRRETARIVQYGSPAERRAQKGVKEVPFTAIHAFESINFSPTLLINLLSAEGDADQKLGRDEVNRQIKEFKVLFSNLRISAVAAGLLTFHVYADGDGNLQTGSSGAVVDVDYGVSATHNETGGTGAIVTASWATAGTDMIGDIRAIKEKILQASGYSIMHCFYGSDIPKYVAANTAASKYLAANPDLSRQYYQTGEVPPGFMDLQWHAMGDQFFVDQDGTAQKILADDCVVFTPEPSPDWYELIQGTYPVPMNFGSVATDAQTLIQGMTETAGQFAYAGGTLNPPSVEMYAGDTFLPVVKVPTAVFKADVIF